MPRERTLPEAEVAHEFPVSTHSTLLEEGHIDEVEGVAEAVTTLLLDRHGHRCAVALGIGIEVASKVIMQLDILPHGRSCKE